MRTYLVSGFIQFQLLTDWLPLKAHAVLEDGEVMDLSTIAKIEAQLLHENNLTNTIAKRVAITHFQAVNTAARLCVPVESDLQLNECAVVLPPVDSPLLIEIKPCMILRAIRPEFAEHRGDQLLFNLEGGGQYIGRPRWTHP
ncbi:hypothetical protein GOD54_23525 [Sinorhizobium medicae]|nr:hypothetical protein [Sinorhizobium medicae]